MGRGSRAEDRAERRGMFRVHTLTSVPPDRTSIRSTCVCSPRSSSKGLRGECARVRVTASINVRVTSSRRIWKSGDAACLRPPSVAKPRARSSTQGNVRVRELSMAS